MAFSDLGLSGKVLQAVESSGYSQPTPIQAEAIPHVLARRDVLGIAQTGTGKTAAFTLPMLTLLETGRARARMPRTLILEPTRELAAQVEESFVKYGANHRLNVALLIGGVSFADQDAIITRGADVLIATPGRLLDHFERGRLLLSGIEVLVIDEADRMLDMGFIPDIERICKMVPFTRQTLFFSATMPPEIQRLVDNFLSNPVRIEVARASSTAHTITQLAVASASDAAQKRKTLRRLIRDAEELKNGIIFCNRKRDIAVVLRSLQKHGFSVAALHGDMDQRSRMQALDAFRNNEVQLLIASDVAARGLDIPDVSHVFNYDTPHHAEDYVHRIGRTGRAGRKGTAYTIITPDDSKSAAAIVGLTGKEFDWLGDALTEDAASDHDNGGRHDRRRDKDGKRGRDGRRRERNGASDAQGAEQPVHQEASATDPAAHTQDDKRPERRQEPRQERRDDKREDKREAQPDTRNERRDSRSNGRNGQRDERRSGNGRHERDEPSPLGFGDHTPAFMLVKAHLTVTKPARARDAAREKQPVTPTAIAPTIVAALPQHDALSSVMPAELDNLHEAAPTDEKAQTRERRSRSRRGRRPASEAVAAAADQQVVNVAADVASAIAEAAPELASGADPVVAPAPAAAPEPVEQVALAPAPISAPNPAPTSAEGPSGEVPTAAAPKPATASETVIAVEPAPASEASDASATANADAVAPQGAAASAAAPEPAPKPRRARTPRKPAAAVEAVEPAEVASAEPAEPAEVVEATPVKKPAAPRRRAAAKDATGKATAGKTTTGKTTATKTAAAARASTVADEKAPAEPSRVNVEASDATTSVAPAAKPAPVRKRAPRKTATASKAAATEPAAETAGSAASADSPEAGPDAGQEEAKAARPARTRTRRSARSTPPRASEAEGDGEAEA